MHFPCAYLHFFPNTIFLTSQRTLAKGDPLRGRLWLLEEHLSHLAWHLVWQEVEN